MTIAELSTSECLTLLREVHVGRLAVVIDGMPDIFPINFAVDHGTVVFRSAEGTKLDAISDRAALAFESDGTVDGEAWSVVVKGTAVRMRGTELIDTENLELHPQQEGRKPAFVRIEPVSITGRRFPMVDQQEWITDLSGIAPSPPE